MTLSFLSWVVQGGFKDWILGSPMLVTVWLMFCVVCAIFGRSLMTLLQPVNGGFHELSNPIDKGQEIVFRSINAFLIP